MSNYFVFHWPCGKCVCGACVDNPRGKWAAKDEDDVLAALRRGERVSYQFGGSVSIGVCTCSEKETGEGK